MSDFLTNLAARAIAPPTLRPRIRSRFEPAPEEPLAPEWPVTQSRAQRAQTERRLPAGRSAAFQAAGPPEPPTPAGMPADQPAGSRRSAEDATPVVIEHVSREVEHDVQRIVETQERIVRVPERVETEREVLRHRYETQPPRVVREPSPEVHHHRHTRITTERAPQPIAPTKEIVAQSTPEPTVHVSIGRIEVRAVPQPQQQTQREPKRGITIDDYVARRKAKERR